MHAIWLRKTVLLFLFGIFFVAGLVWFITDYAHRSRAGALTLQISPTPSSLTVATNTVGTTTFSMEVPNGQVLTAYDLKFAIEGPLFIQAAPKPVLVGSSLGQDSITQFILSENRVSYGFIGSAAQLSQRVEQPIVIACDSAGQGKLTLESTSQFVGKDGAFEVNQTAPITVDCQGSSRVARPIGAKAATGLTIQTSPPQPQSGAPYDVALSLPTAHATRQITGVTMEVTFNPSVLSLLSVSTPNGELVATSELPQGQPQPVPVENATNGGASDGQSSDPLTTVTNTGAGTVNDVQGVSTSAESAAVNTGDFSNAPTTKNDSSVLKSGSVPQGGSVTIDQNGHANIKTAFSPAQINPLMTLHFQGLQNGDAGLTINSIHYITADGEDLSIPDSSVSQSDLSDQAPLDPDPNSADLPVIVGDVNHDGVINSFDLLAIKDILGSSDADSLSIGDLNGDGGVNVQDYSMVITSFTQQ